MKKISESRAIELINSGTYPKCKVSRGVFHVVRSLTELSTLKELGKHKTQLFELYEETTSSQKLPTGSMELTIDDAFELVTSKINIHCIHNGKTEEITTLNELRNIITSCNIRGDEFVLYWIVV